MWPRVVEVMFGCWLAISPFIFTHPPDQPLLWWNDLGCAAVVVALALASFHPRWRRAHLLEVAVGAWLIGAGYFAAEQPPPAATQNDVLVGWLLLMFAVIPSETNRPPAGWERRLRSETRD
ncbi:MAG: SPW repeat protein [Planctomycetaceae bacterium]